MTRRWLVLPAAFVLLPLTLLAQPQPGPAKGKAKATEVRPPDEPTHQAIDTNLSSSKLGG